MNKTKKILIVASNPKNTGRLRLDEEIREIEKRRRLSLKRGHFEIFQSWAVRIEDLRSDLLHYKPEIVHFSVHGDLDGILIEDQFGEKVAITPDFLAELFEFFKEFIVTKSYSSSIGTIQDILLLYNTNLIDSKGI